MMWIVDRICGVYWVSESTTWTEDRRLLGSKTLCLNVLELQFVMLANHDQNV